MVKKPRTSHYNVESSAEKEQKLAVFKRDGTPVRSCMTDANSLLSTTMARCSSCINAIAQNMLTE